MNWLQRFMIGRYGIDQLSKAMLILTFILLMISTFTRSSIINFIAVIILALTYARILSRNVNKRYQENMKFLQWWNPISLKINRYFKHLNERKTYRFYKCSNCGQRLRVPKGKGKIRIICPKCQNTIIKRT